MYVFTTIKHLLTSGSPSDVAGFVVTLSVDTVDGVMRRRSVSYGVQELLKRFKTKLNPPTAIERVAIIFRQFATLPRVVVRAVFGCWRVGVPMRSSARHQQLCSDASAGRCPLIQIARRDDRPLTAVATTKPIGIIEFAFTVITKNSELAVLFAGQILEAGSGWNGWIKRYLLAGPKHEEFYHGYA